MKTFSTGLVFRFVAAIFFVSSLLISTGCEKLCQNNNDCSRPDLEYCAKEAGACDATGLCVKRPEACIMILDPVCGCDNATYDNACLAAAQGVNILTEGVCEDVLCNPEACGPALGMPNILCEDGSLGGPTGRCLQTPEGTCAWEIRECPANPDCAQEGELFSFVYEDYPDQCCAGLDEWLSGMDTRISIGADCYSTGLVAGAPVGTCLNCGNGICEEIEDVCNCPGDCTDGSNADYPTVEAFCAEAWSPDLADFCQAQPLPVPDVNPYYELICNLCAAL